MKKILSIFAIGLAAITFASCAGEEDDLFDQSAAERLNAASDLYSQRLTAQPNGWAMQLYPTTQNESPYGSGYLVLLRFHPNHQVDVAMDNLLTNNAYQSDSSMWEVITDDGPVLTFNTYNDVMHKFSDPEDVPQTGDRDNPNDETGTGIGGDYEFIVVDAPEDASYMMLKGKKRGTYNLLTPVEQGVDYRSYLADVKNFQANMFPAGYETADLLHVGDSVYNVEGADDGLPNIYLRGSDAIINESFNPFIITKRGDDYYLRFRDQKTYNGITLQELRYDASTDHFVDPANSSVYMEGNDPMVAWNNLLTNGTKRIHWYGVFQNRSTASPCSGSFAEIISAVNAELRAVNPNFGVNSITIRDMGEGKYSIALDYRGQTPATYTDYEVTMTTNEQNVQFTYVGTNTVGQNMLNRVPSLQRVIDFFTAAPMHVTGGSTNFNLNSLRLTSTADQGNWVVLAQ